MDLEDNYASYVQFLTSYTYSIANKRDHAILWKAFSENCCNSPQILLAMSI